MSPCSGAIRLAARSLKAAQVQYATKPLAIDTRVVKTAAADSEAAGLSAGDESTNDSDGSATTCSGTTEFSSLGQKSALDDDGEWVDVTFNKWQGKTRVVDLNTCNKKVCQDRQRHDQRNTLANTGCSIQDGVWDVLPSQLVNLPDATYEGEPESMPNQFNNVMLSTMARAGAWYFGYYSSF